MKKYFATWFLMLALILVLPTFVKAENVSVSPSGSAAVNTNTGAENLMISSQQQLSQLLEQISKLQAELSRLQGEVKKVGEQIEKLTKSLKLGAEGKEVETLQKFLKQDSEIYPEGKVTGYYGPLTEKAVKKFQQKNGIESVGIVGPITMAKINGIIGNKDESKITICHIPDGNTTNRQTITIGKSALEAHLVHGDTINSCTSTQPTTPAAQYYLTIVSPVRWETWTTGSSYYIKWSTNIPATQNITIVRVRDSAGSEHELLTETKNDGIELLTIPSTLASGMYHFEMKAVVGNQSIFGESENTITIVNPNAPAPDPAEVPETKIITVSAEGGYGIIGPGTLAVVVGSDQSFTITPMAGYEVASVIADGVNQGALLSYTFTNVQLAHSLVISFKPISPAPIGQYSITATQGASGTIFPALASVTAGSSITFTITPATGYQVASVIVDGVNQGAISSYTFTNVQAPHSITATFSPISTTQSCSLTVSLAATTPAAQYISPGQSAVSLIKFNATPNCSGTLNSFAVSLLPMPNGYQNISALRLYNDTTGAQLGTTQNVTIAGMNFPSVNTPLTANQPLVLRVDGDVSSSAVSGSMVYGVFGGSSAVNNSGGVIGNNASGNIIMGNTMTVVAGSSNLPLSNSQPPAPSSPTPTSYSYSGSVGIPYTYTTMIYPDPDGNQVKATFDWGDGMTTDSSFVTPVSGQSFSSTHSWSTNGVYSVKAKEVDSTGLSSAWSSAAIYSTITITGTMTSAVDTTIRIMYWWGKVNQHTDANGNWLTDPDGVSGADLDKLTYCKKFYPNTIGVEDYMLETTDTWLNRGNVDGPFTSTKMSTKCLQPTVSNIQTNNQMANALEAMRGILSQLQELLKNR